MTFIFVDADACPVKPEIEQVISRHKIKTFIVSNGGLKLSHNPFVKTIVVSEGPDTADIWISERISAGDLVITVDIPLASKCVQQGAVVLRHDGQVLTDTNIGQHVATRALMTSLRAADPFYQSQIRKFAKADRSRFLNSLENTLRKIKR